MKKIFALTILATLIIFSSNCFAAQIPPEEYVLNEIMPYGDGTAGINKRLKMNGACNMYNLPRGSKVTGSLKAGDFINVTDSRVYTKPLLHPVRVSRTTQVATSPKGEFRKTFYIGDYFYLLMPIHKDGGYIAWYDGGLLWLRGNITNFDTDEYTGFVYEGEPTDRKLGIELWLYVTKESDGTSGWAWIDYNP